MTLDDTNDDTETEIEDDTPPAAEPAAVALDQDQGGDFERAVKKTLDGMPADLRADVLAVMHGSRLDDEIWGPIAAMSLIAARGVNETRRAASVGKEVKALREEIAALRETVHEIPTSTIDRIDNAVDEKLREILNSFGQHATKRFKDEQKSLAGLLEQAWDRSLSDVAKTGAPALFRVVSPKVLAMLAMPLLIGLALGAGMVVAALALAGGL